jgi:alpha-tubulin suppressor-like RCC1 family protein
MQNKANVLIGVCVVTFLAAGTRDEASAQGVTVTPANPAISVGQTQQFTAPDVSTATDVGAGDYHGCAVLQNGAARCWGYNGNGQLGNGTVNPSSTPVAVFQIAQAVAISSGGAHTGALLQGGTVQCWGLNDVGQLGDGTTATSLTPVNVSGITTAIAVSAGYKHSCALLGDGTVRCWGDNSYGELGTGTFVPSQVRGGPPTDSSSVPVAVTGISTAVGVSASRGYHTCAVLQNGTVRCWGDNGNGQLGDGSSTTSATPVTTAGITTATAVAAGDFHSCALLQDGTVDCWGLNYSGQLGDGSMNSSYTPVRVSGISTAVAVSTGVIHSCAVLQGGTVRCWGNNGSGELGDGTTTDSCIPVTARGISSAIRITTGYNNSCARLQGGLLQCWGINTYGQLGNGSTADAHTPTTVVGIAATWTSSDSTVATIDATGLASGHSPGSATITATFNGQSGSTTLTVGDRPQLTVVRNGIGIVTSNPSGIDCGATCSAFYDVGRVVTLAATPLNGSTFTGWIGCDAVSGTTCTVTMSAEKFVTATFVKPTLTVSKAGTGRGSVTASEPGLDCGPTFDTCMASYGAGTALTLTATPIAGSTFDNWSGCDSATTNTCSVMMDASKTVSPTFSRLRFTLTVSKSGMGGGTVTSSPSGINCGSSCSAAYDSGTVVTLTATPATGSVFNGWSGCDTASGATCTVTMSAAKSVAANFLGIPLP